MYFRTDITVPRQFCLDTMEEQLSVLILFSKKSFWKTFNTLTKAKKIIMPSRLVKQTPWTAELNVPLSDSHRTSRGVIFLLLYGQNFKIYLEIKLLPVSARARGLYISGWCIKLA